MSLATHNKKHRLQRISSEKPLNKREQLHQVPKQQTMGRQESLISRVVTLLFKMPSFQRKITRLTKKQEKMAHAPGKKAINKTCP